MAAEWACRTRSYVCSWGPSSSQTRTRAREENTCPDQGIFTGFGSVSSIVVGCPAPSSQVPACTSGSQSQNCPRVLVPVWVQACSGRRIIKLITTSLPLYTNPGKDTELSRMFISPEPQSERLRQRQRIYARAFGGEGAGDIQFPERRRGCWFWAKPRKLRTENQAKYSSVSITLIVQHGICLQVPLADLKPHQYPTLSPSKCPL
ncbi:hypothetical protein BU23DRAFT_165352 [Bimuria novae-zelandiae CBS 107.79]|uniref:Uncharacterized protein n=1 Tax=Bimuria novae-zelandiae CBS 107.79 TaxID=1447943 RepID=A0A6A5V4Y6_9PLEO|nr:hypothetical protein BU23DRAFT_165352 [Bimuria novae-zelandiae CBS 107.79]